MSLVKSRAGVRKSTSSNAAEANLSLKEISKTYRKSNQADNVVLNQLDLDIKEGEFFTLLGSSGSGKSTILMIIAGFTSPDQGAVYLGRTNITNLPPQKRNMGVVFQNYALFPHMTVSENIAFPLEVKGVKEKEIKKRVDTALELVGLSSLAGQLPSEISGGQAQRAALARAVVFEPKILLMDEPMGALDRRLRLRLQRDVRRLQRELGLTAVSVTHDQQEALSMSDRVGLLHQGDLLQVGTPENLYEAPKTRYIAEFMGEVNCFNAVVGKNSGARTEVLLENGESLTLASSNTRRTGDKLLIGVRPENLTLVSGISSGPSNVVGIRGIIREIEYFGTRRRYHIDVEGLETVKVDVYGNHASRYSLGDLISVAIDGESCFVLESVDE